MTHLRSAIAVCLLLGPCPCVVGVAPAGAAQADTQTESRAASAARTALKAARQAWEASMARPDERARNN
jgi:hypothetical protein